MIYDLIIKEEASLEIVAAYLYYESKSVGLGDKFEIQLGIYLDRICQYPLHYEVKRKPYREAFIKKFPFIIIYEILENTIVVYSVFNTNRSPSKKPIKK